MQRVLSGAVLAAVLTAGLAAAGTPGVQAQPRPGTVAAGHTVAVASSLDPSGEPSDSPLAASRVFTVTSTMDAPAANPLSGRCRSTLPGGACTLRAAIQVADDLPTGSAALVILPFGNYLLTSGTLMLTANRITIAGSARGGGPTINGNNNGAVMSISSSAQAAIYRVRISGGYAEPGNGGGIANQGALMVAGSTLSGNAASGSGGGIYNTGVLTVTNSTLSGNAAGAGGGIYSMGALTVIASGFDDNTSAQGGGIFVASGTATVSDSTLNVNLANNSQGAGGGIYNEVGTMTVTTSTLSSNQADNSQGDGEGGGIYNWGGSITVTGSTLSGNSAGYNGGSGGGGGGIYNFGALTLTNSTLSNNTAGDGGGIDNSYSYGLTMANSTLSGNTATYIAGDGGGINNYFAALALTNDTISGNSAPADYGGGIGNFGFGPNTTVAVTGTIFANNSAGGNCAGSVVSQGYNLDDGTTCGFSQTSDLTNTNPLLGSLANNGGPTQTMALQSNSPAIDRGATRAQGCPATDQRGYARPDPEDGAQGPCDMGAFESGAIAP